MRNQRPNIVLICVDQWRGDCLGLTGHPVVKTPYLDQLATEGACFTRAYTATPSCIAARAGLYTGLSQRSHGRVGYSDGVPWNYPVTIASEFTRGGYQTQAVGKLHVFPERSQMGFQNVVLHDGYMHYARAVDHQPQLLDDYLPWLRQRAGHDADYFDHGLNANAQVARPWDKPEALHPTNFVVTQGIEFLRRRDPRKPFFLFLSFHRPHPPYDPPAWAMEQYLDVPMADPPVGDWASLYDEYNDESRADLFVGKLDEQEMRRARAGYYGLITHIDHQINRFLETLFEYRQSGNTYICFVSDHGEMLGDHRLWRKSFPYEGSARVPLILQGPKAHAYTQTWGGCYAIPGDSQVREVVELRDVMPTLLDCAGLPIPDCVEGRSVLPLLRGETANWRTHLHGEHPWSGQALHWIIDGRYKYVWLSGTGHEQLFDMDSDPTEIHDLASNANEAARLRQLRDLLVRELAGREEGYSDGSKLITGRAPRTCLSHILDTP